MQRACNFLARREHSRKELQNKLSHGCDNEQLIEELLDKLSREGLQSDKRFTEDFIQHRVNKGQGPVRIEQELRQRGIEQSLIDKFLASGTFDWLSLAEQVRVKKFGQSVPGEYQIKAKQSRFLYSRGFNSDVISQLLK